ncbi:hypothetical protein BGX34_002552 [Mortierella sp. NVP85]|nr:hypothetical protein BGX34_002552 [Mortierella sp. NVP85]
MPEPPHGSDYLQAEDEGVVLDTEAESHREPVKNQDKGKGKDMGQKQGEAPGRPVAVQGLFNGDGNKSSNSQASSDNKTPKAKPNGTTVVAAATIAAAAATSAAAAALALKRGRKAKPIVHEKEETTVEVIDNTETTKSTKTVVHFRPSKDTVSSHAYWWGYEIFIPNTALSRIASAQDVSTAFLGFLGSVGLVVPAIVPFLGYIAAYVGLEFAVIKAQNEGKGVILASTWLVPVALVPRPWDVPDDEDTSSSA